MSYGPNQNECFTRVGALIDKILKESKPSEIPVEQPTKFDFVMNLKNRQANWFEHSTQRLNQGGSSHPMTLESRIGNRKSKIVRIPPHVLARADNVIR